MRFIITLFLILFSNTIFASENDVAELMKTNTAKFIVADKKEGYLYLVDPTTNEILKAPALYGRGIGDVLPADDLNVKKSQYSNITPSGEFKVTRMYSTKLRQYILVFLEGKTAVMAIHKLYTGNKAQRREERIQSADPNEKRITNGCINIPVDFWDLYLERIPDNTKLYVLPD